MNRKMQFSLMRAKDLWYMDYNDWIFAVFVIFYEESCNEVSLIIKIFIQIPNDSLRIGFHFRIFWDPQ